MAESKKYYYMRVKENFFDSDEMLLLESMPDGYLYSNILLKLYCRSLKNEGRLMLNEKIPFNTTMLARVTRHSIGVIEKAMQIFQDLGLIEVLDNGAIYMLEIQQFIGQSSSEGDRIKAYRQKIESEKIPQLQQCTDSVQNPYICTPKIELELELNLDLKKETNKNKKEHVVFDLSEYSEQVKESFLAFIEMRKEKKEPLTERGFTLIKNKLKEFAKNDKEMKMILDDSYIGGWKSVYPLNKKQIDSLKQITEEQKPVYKFSKPWEPPIDPDAPPRRSMHGVTQEERERIFTEATNGKFLRTTE